MRDAESGKQIASATSNLTRYGCHVRTSPPFLPGTPVKLIIKHQGITFQSSGKVVYAIGGEGMGIHFGNVEIVERVILKEWLVQVGTEELEHRLRERTQTEIALSNKEKLFLVTCVVGLAAIIAGALAYFGVLP